MSIDTTDESVSGAIPADDVSNGDHGWDALQQKIEDSFGKLSVERVFGDAARQGSVYRWGMAVADAGACDDLTCLLSRLACNLRPAKYKSELRGIDRSAESFARQAGDIPVVTPRDAAATVLWGAALPALSKHLPQQRWRQLLGALQQLRQSVVQAGESSSPSHLMIGGELGLTLAWRLSCLPHCAELKSASIAAVNKWCQCEAESVSAAIATCSDSRLVLASLIRCQAILREIGTRNQRLSKQLQSTGEALMTWVAAMTTHTGTAALSGTDGKDVRDDLPPKGLLGCAAQLNRKAFEPAIAAALGKTQTGGRLVWQIDLPETMHHDPDAKLAVMFPDWDVRRGRTHIDYSGNDPKIEVFAGRAEVIAGQWQTQIAIDGVELRADGEWCEVCEYSDDDVHYLEIEQDWTGGMILQRQIMLVRDDRCLLLADAVLPAATAPPSSKMQGSKMPGSTMLGSIEYSSRLPLCSSVRVEPEADTREVFLNDGRRRGLVIPLSASEWRIGPTSARLKGTEDRHLLLSAQGRERLYAPLWFDFQQRRFKRKRTWRQLTIADQLRIVGQHEATGFRVQVGSEQWVIYRSMSEPCCRSILGKHLIADFYCSRFDPGDGSHDELVTVDDHQTDDE